MAIVANRKPENLFSTLKDIKEIKISFFPDPAYNIEEVTKPLKKGILIADNYKYRAIELGGREI